MVTDGGILSLWRCITLAKRKANHVINGMNAAKGQGQGAGYNEEYSNEPLTAAQRQFNKKRKTNQ